ncbi:MAG: hypothetical protein PUH48_09285, partial [Prevotella sp.]|nr:hypothetical protein [Prevotella sp.]
MANISRTREEEVKNRIRDQFFQEYDATPVIGDIDFAVTLRQNEGLPELFDREYFLWAEAKAGTKEDILASFVQLIITIGKARTHEKLLPPRFLGAFDEEKIAFIEFHNVMEVFYQNDFNWNVTPSNHETREFHYLYDLLHDQLSREISLFDYKKDEKDLRRFIRSNFKMGKKKVMKTRINKNNFPVIYQKWLVKVKSTIVIDWEQAKKNGIIDADFFLADILSKENITLKEKLFVLLKKNFYELDRKVDSAGLFDMKRADFNDGQVAHEQFWNRYERPPRKEYWDYIVQRRDLLVPQDIRERKGSYFTPQQWVELSQQYIADELGENWQDEYYVWDCCAGTGNLLAGLTNKYHIWVSTLDKADVDVMHDRIAHMNESGGSNLLDSHVFQFDFLNDSFDRLPDKLKEIISDPLKCCKLVIYINPPYAEASNARTITGTGENRKGLASTSIKERYKKELGRAGNEIFAQFFARIVSEIPTCVLAVFSKLKTLQGPNFTGFRNQYRAKLGRIFLTPAETFDNVSGQFPIGFQIFHIAEKEEFVSIKADVYDHKAQFIGTKNLYSYKDEKYIIHWLRQYYDKAGKKIAYLRFLGTDFQNNNGVFITLSPSANDLKQVKGNWITPKNVLEACIYFSVRLCIEATWLNDRDQFLYPNDGWKTDAVFQSDCLVFTLFNGQNRISSRHGVNHWIPFSEEEVGAQDSFDSHFMHDFITGKAHSDSPRPAQEQDLFGNTTTSSAPQGAITFSAEAQAVMDAGRELWRYYHSQEGANPNASYYDIRLHFQGTKTTAKGK